MTEQKPQRKGRDFAISFFGCLLLMALEVVLFVGLYDGTVSNSTFQASSLGIIAIIVAALVIAFVAHRKFIGIGILSALIAGPLLLTGSCFAIAAFN